MEQWSELAGQTAVVEVNQQMMIPEERGPKDGTRNFRDPEVLEEGVALGEGDRKTAARICLDSGPISRYQVR